MRWILKMDISQDYICIKALSPNVSVMGVTRGEDSRLHHTEKLACGEVMICQFTENTAAIKIRGHAEILTKYGKLTSEE